jgi:PPOX class probable F420-dependent enzyme
VAIQPSQGGNSEDLSAHRNLLLVSFRRDGRPVPTPVWFASVGDVLYVRSEANSGKIKRIRRDDRVVMAPCDGRGRPLGPSHDATARVLAGDETIVAETALAARYGIVRRFVERVFFRHRQFDYLEVRLASDAASTQAVSS